MKILLVEDSYIERRKIGGYLEDWGLEHVSVGNGTEAVKLLESPDAPEFAILDWVLPGLDGIDVLRRIRKQSHGKYIYALMLTAKNRKQDLLTAMEAGADDYLSKPVDPAELRSRIMVGKRILDLQRSLRFAATHDFLTGPAEPGGNYYGAGAGVLAQRARGQAGHRYPGGYRPLQARERYAGSRRGRRSSEEVAQQLKVGPAALRPGRAVRR